jgi:hypothetical protein
MSEFVWHHFQGIISEVFKAVITKTVVLCVVALCSFIQNLHDPAITRYPPTKLHGVKLQKITIIQESLPAKILSRDRWNKKQER